MNNRFRTLELELEILVRRMKYLTGEVLEVLGISGIEGMRRDI